MEHFSVHVFGMSEQDYSLATFKEAEKTIEEGRSMMEWKGLYICDDIVNKVKPVIIS